MLITAIICFLCFVSRVFLPLFHLVVFRKSVGGVVFFYWKCFLHDTARVSKKRQAGDLFINTKWKGQMDFGWLSFSCSLPLKSILSGKEQEQIYWTTESGPGSTFREFVDSLFPIFCCLVPSALFFPWHKMESPAFVRNGFLSAPKCSDMAFPLEDGHDY